MCSVILAQKLFFYKDDGKVGEESRERECPINLQLAIIVKITRVAKVKCNAFQMEMSSELTKKSKTTCGSSMPLYVTSAI